MEHQTCQFLQRNVNETNLGIKSRFFLKFSSLESYISMRFLRIILKLYCIFTELGLVNCPLRLIFCLEEEIGKRDITPSFTKT